jgi:Beta-lactamase
MTTIIMPTPDQLCALVKPYLDKQPSGLAFAIGYASPQFSSPYGFFYFKGNVSSQFGQTLTLDKNTPFQLASVSKTFTATLYALLVRSANPSLTVGDYIVPNGPLQISSTLAGISLDELVNYTSGLPQDNETDVNTTPPNLPLPYSMTGMLSYLNASPPAVSGTGTTYTYSNLAFGLMAAILSGTTPRGRTDSRASSASACSIRCRWRRCISTKLRSRFCRRPMLTTTSRRRPIGRRRRVGRCFRPISAPEDSSLRRMTCCDG